MSAPVAAVLPDLDEWIAGGEVSTFDQHRIFYRQDGPADGRPIILLHGFPTSSHDWAGVVPALTGGGHRVTTLDFLGFGASDKPRGHDYSIREQADIVERLHEHLGVETTAMVAHDYGVSVAQELLARDSKRFTAMTWLNGGIYPDLHRPITIQKLLHHRRIGPVLGRLSSERTFRMAMRKITERPIGHADLHAMWRSVSSNGGTRVQTALLSYIDERKAHADRWTRALESYPGPTTFIWGPDDPISGGHVLPRISERVPDARLIVLDGVGHYPQVEDPDAVAAALLR
ncbi:MAG TPA: alpha/beta hydrolase [Aeromicrobium sp.]|nr:alpha/beta hydrolase [Aeromicrobium sp.]